MEKNAQKEQKIIKIICVFAKLLLPLPAISSFACCHDRVFGSVVRARRRRYWPLHPLACLGESKHQNTNQKTDKGMRKFLALAALTLFMISATAMDYQKPAPFDDVGICFVQQTTSATDMQTVDYGFAPVEYSCVEVLPLVLETYFEGEAVGQFPLFATPLRKEDLCAIVEPPVAYIKNSPVWSNAATRFDRFKRRC